MPSTRRTLSKPAKASSAGAKAAKWIFVLYVSGQTQESLLAFSNIKKICADHLKEKYHIDVIDLLVHPHLAKDDQILATPTLVRRMPQPELRIVGNLSDTQRVVEGLDLCSFI